MASMRDIKRRRASVTSTQQITKAMKLVSTVKLQHAKASAESGAPYFHGMYDIVGSILERSKGLRHRYLPSDTPRDGHTAVIMITSNKGLAGGYNSNVWKLVREQFPDTGAADIYAIGRNGRDALASKGYHIALDAGDIVDAPTYEDARALCARLLEAYDAGSVSEIYLAYTFFKNTVSHVPTILKLLPVSDAPKPTEDGGARDGSAPMNFEMDDEEALDLLIPKYITSLIYGGLLQSVASEHGARMQAMDSATSNAEDMIDNLTLMYNRARQGSITQELTEIIAGAEAIS